MSCASTAGFADKKHDADDNEGDDYDAGPEAGLEYSRSESAPGCRYREQQQDEESR
jgi:hypothetical protein